MAGIVVVGSQWGDEGKGKVVDLFCQTADAVARYQGGDNAGHTVYHGGNKFELSALPVGIINPKHLAIIGNGEVVNPKELLTEMKGLLERGIDLSGLRISDRAQVIMPYHIALDGLAEEASGGRIGTTKKGIGPTYADKINRQGIRMVDLIDPEAFAEALKQVLPLKNNEITKLYGGQPFDYETVYNEYSAYGKELAKYVTDVTVLMDELTRENKRIVFEGAQGVMLDIDHGTYPFVTSSNPVGAGAAVGTGVGPDKIHEVAGVVKAYTSRVGEGPFPTELKNEMGSHIREIGHEYGVITKRPRRIGWLDTVALRHAVLVAGITELAVNSLDVLSGLKEVKIAVAYEKDGQRIDNFPANLRLLKGATAIYETLPGWSEDISDDAHFEDLPVNAQNYLKRISELLERPLLSFAVGPHAEQTHLLKDLWSDGREAMHSA
ncbi:adenylosuccinate synthase [Oenococcus sp.]|uniref:adenylosuccinate synthase n=1 Tax=Oenococcus sp. TaxID=1979414 RepID=UPI0039EBAE4B